MYNYILDYIYIIRSVYIYDRQLKRSNYYDISEKIYTRDTVFVVV